MMTAINKRNHMKTINRLYYLNGRMVDRNEITKEAKFVKKVKAIDNKGFVEYWYKLNI
jgi:hypothetical protein